MHFIVINEDVLDGELRRTSCCIQLGRTAESSIVGVVVCHQWRSHVQPYFDDTSFSDLRDAIQIPLEFQGHDAVYRTIIWVSPQNGLLENLSTHLA